MNDDYYIIQYFFNKAKFLSLDFDEQKKEVAEFNMGDYLTEDIANEWFDEDIELLNELQRKKIINNEVVKLYTIINDNFMNYSLKGKKCEKNIWTLNALKNHHFWNKQRSLAKQFINELSKNSIIKNM